MQTTLIVLGVIIAIFFIFRFYAMAKIKNTPLVADHEKVLTLTEANFQLSKKRKIKWCWSIFGPVGVLPAE